MEEKEKEFAIFMLKIIMLIFFIDLISQLENTLTIGLVIVLVIGLLINILRL